MQLRRATEERMRALFIEAGGRPERIVPHCFVLGTSAWFRGLYADTAEAVLPLGALPDAATSFTYPDSVTALGLGADYGMPSYPRAYHGRVYEGHQRQPFEYFIEIQLWSDDVLCGFSVERRGESAQ